MVLGNPRLAETTALALEAKKAEADRFAKSIYPMIKEIRGSGVSSLRAIARTLTERRVLTARGGEWTAVQVSAIEQRAA